MHWPRWARRRWERHYDPLYERSFRSSYRQLLQAHVVALADAEAATLQEAAHQLVG